MHKVDLMTFTSLVLPLGVTEGPESVDFETGLLPPQEEHRVSHSSPPPPTLPFSYSLVLPSQYNIVCRLKLQIPFFGDFHDSSFVKVTD